MTKMSHDVKKELLTRRLLKVAAKWKQFGIQLGIHMNELNKMKPKKRSCDECFLQMLSDWSNDAVRKWGEIYRTLKDMQYDNLRRQLISKYPFDSKIVLRVLVNELKEIEHEWKLFGTHLGIERHKLKAIAQEESVDDCLIDVIDIWCRRQKNGPNYPLNEIYEALKHIGEGRLAKELSDFFNGSQMRSSNTIQTDGSDRIQTDDCNQHDDDDDDETNGDLVPRMSEMSIESGIESEILEEDLLTTRLQSLGTNEVATTSVPQDNPENISVTMTFSRPEQATSDESSSVFSRTSEVFQTPHEASEYH